MFVETIVLLEHPVVFQFQLLKLLILSIYLSCLLEEFGGSLSLFHLHAMYQCPWDQSMMLPPLCLTFDTGFLGLKASPLLLLWSDNSVFYWSEDKKKNSPEGTWLSPTGSYKFQWSLKVSILKQGLFLVCTLSVHGDLHLWKPMPFCF